MRQWCHSDLKRSLHVISPSPMIEMWLPSVCALLPSLLSELWCLISIFLLNITPFQSYLKLNGFKSNLFFLCPPKLPLLCVTSLK